MKKINLSVEHAAGSNVEGQGNHDARFTGELIIPTANIAHSTFGSQLPPEVNVAPGDIVPFYVQTTAEHGGQRFEVVLECVSFDPATRWAEFKAKPSDAPILALLFAGPNVEQVN